MKGLILSILLTSSASLAQVYSGYEGITLFPTVTIASGSASSAAVSLKGFSLVGVQFPAAFSGSAITFAAADTLTGSYSTVKTGTSGTTLSYTISAGNYSAIDPKDFYGIKFLKIVLSGTQTSPQSLICSLKGF